MLNYYENSNEHARDMIHRLVQEGKIIGTRDEKTEKEVKSIYPRLHTFKTQLSGLATVNANSECVVMTRNVSREIRQGDAVIIEGCVYRGILSSHSLNSIISSLFHPLLRKQHQVIG